MSQPDFNREFDPNYGKPVQISSHIQRLTAPNPSPFTFHGTNTYILGHSNVAVIDPGPEDMQHLEALSTLLEGRTVSHIIITHTHIDHSPLARKLKANTGAPIFAEGPHRPARPLADGETNILDASGDKDFIPDEPLHHLQTIDGEDWQLECIATPGHTMNHMCFALTGTDFLFSGDHVMGWATSIVAPPDGAMREYMRSLDVLAQYSQTTYLPGHGGPINRAKDFVRALRTHRKMREAAIIKRIEAGDKTIDKIVKRLYRDIDPKLHGAAALSVFAHIEDLVEQEIIACHGPAQLEGEYWATPAK